VHEATTASPVRDAQLARRALLYVAPPNAPLPHALSGVAERTHRFAPEQLGDLASDADYACALVDAAVGLENTEEIVAALRRAAPTVRTPILLLSTPLKVAERLEQIHAGVSRIVDPNSDLDELVSAMEVAIADFEPSRGTVFFFDQKGCPMGAQLQGDLEPADYRVVVADSLTDIIRAWLERSPDVFVIYRDHARPPAEDICKGVRRAPSLRNVAVLLLTERQGLQARREVYTMGADDYIALPYLREELLARVGSRLDRRRYQGRAARLGDAVQLSRAVRGASPSAGRISLRDLAVERPLGPLRVLVADHDTFVRNILRHHLTRAGWSVTDVADGERAETLLKREHFDVALLDIFLPFRSGFDILESLKAEPEPPNTRIVVLTSMNQEDAMLRAFALGAADYVVKPFQPEVVVSRIRAMLAGGSGQP
jgi:two-component system response regulator VicR